MDALNPDYSSLDGVLFDKSQIMLIQCPGGKTSYTIPDSVTSIGDRGFEGCTSLTNVTIGNSVTSIGALCVRRLHRPSVSIGNQRPASNLGCSTTAPV